MLKFVSKFTDQEIPNVVEKDNSFYLVKGDLKDIKGDFVSIGVYLGKRDKDFKPSIELLNILSKISKKKVFINEKAEWKFLNRKDIIGRSIKKANVDSGLVLVQNMKDENLGYGKIIANLRNKEQIVISNLLDKGEYLRMER